MYCIRVKFNAILKTPRHRQHDQQLVLLHSWKVNDTVLTALPLWVNRQKSFLPVERYRTDCSGTQQIGQGHSLSPKPSLCPMGLFTYGLTGFWAFQLLFLHLYCICKLPTSKVIAQFSIFVVWKGLGISQGLGYRTTQTSSRLIRIKTGKGTALVKCISHEGQWWDYGYYNYTPIKEESMLMLHLKVSWSFSERLFWMLFDK